MDFLEPLGSLKRRRNKLADTVRSLAEKIELIQRDIAKHKSFNPEQCVMDLAKLRRSMEIDSKNLADAEASLSAHSLELQKLADQKVGLIRVRKFFSNEQKLLRSKFDALKIRIKNENDNINTIKNNIIEIASDIEGKSRELSEFQSFNCVHFENHLRKLIDDKDLNQEELSELDAEIGSISDRIGHLVADHHGLQAQIHRLNSKISGAEALERALARAKNGYEKAQIHSDCGSRFGNGSPKKVQHDALREIRSIERDLGKLERRIQVELNKHFRVVSHIIIDGNNACYDRSVFIRFHALTHLIDKLIEKYRVTVVFDASIRGLMKTDDAGIERIVGRSAVIHVAPTRTGADEYILRLAEGKPETYILSNDRFAEFGEYDAVKSRRLLRFLIAGSQVLINDLDIAIEFRPPL